MATLTKERDELSHALDKDPVKKLVGLVPKPIYKSDVGPLVDEVPIDDFINKPDEAGVFHLLAIMSGLKPSGVQQVRGQSPAQQDAFFQVISRSLSDQLNRFWAQEQYDFKIEIKGDKLTFTVADRVTEKATSVLEGSDGFKWWTSFFLEMAADLSKREGTTVVLLDNPATELHDEGKADILRFLRQMVESGGLQVVYATHERALIDPWQMDRIRVVEKEKEGTRITAPGPGSRPDLLDRIRRSIGSPARYSLFGAPRTIAFEGVSDVYAASAFNDSLSRRAMALCTRTRFRLTPSRELETRPIFTKCFEGSESIS